MTVRPRNLTTRRLTILAVNWHSGGNAGVYTGGGRRARLILGGLARRGHEVHVVDVAPSVVTETPGITSIRAAPAWLRPGVSSAPRPEQAAAALYAAFRLSYLVARALRRVRPDVIYIPAGELLPCLTAGLIGGRLASRPVVACATTIVRWTPQRHDNLLHLSRRLLARAAGTIVLGPAVAEKLTSEGFPGRVLVGLTGVEHSPLPSRPVAPRRLFFLSRIVPEKGVADAVNAFSRANPRNGAVLEIRGSGPADDRNRVSILVKALGMENEVSVGGPIETDAEKWEILSGSWGFIAPSYMEHFGIAIREALSAGLPTVAYCLPPLEDLQGHPCFFDVPLGDVGLLSRGVEKVLGLSAQEREELTASSRHMGVGPTWEEAVEREEQLLAEVSGG